MLGSIRVPPVLCRMSTWATERASDDPKERALAEQQAMEAFVAVNKVMAKLAADDDFHDDLKQPQVQVVSPGPCARQTIGISDAR
jgi:hypothetical protein